MKINWNGFKLTTIAGQNVAKKVASVQHVCITKALQSMDTVAAVLITLKAMVQY